MCQRSLRSPLSKETMKDFVKVQMNPGGSRATIAHIEKGMTMLACRPCSAVEAESLVSMAEVVEQSAKNRTLQESFQIAPRATPKSNYLASQHVPPECGGSVSLEICNWWWLPR